MKQFCGFRLVNLRHAENLFNEFAVFDTFNFFSKRIRRASRQPRKFVHKMGLVGKSHFSGAACPIHLGLLDETDCRRTNPPRPRKLFGRQARALLETSFKLSGA